MSAQEQGGTATKAVCVCCCKTKDQPSPPPRPIETHRGPERQVSKSPARLHQRRSLLCVPHKGGERVILGACGCVVTLGTPRPRTSRARAAGAGPPPGWVPLVAGPNPPRPDNAEGGLGEAFVSQFYTLSFQGGEEGEELKKFLNFNQVGL